MKIALGGLKSPIKEPTATRWSKKGEKLYRKDWWGEQLSKYTGGSEDQRRRWSSNTSHTAGTAVVPWPGLWGPGWLCHWGSQQCLCWTAHNHSCQQSTPGCTQPQSLLGLLCAPQQTTALLPHLRLPTQHCCRPASTLGTGAAADPQGPTLQTPGLRPLHRHPHTHTCDITTMKATTSWASYQKNPTGITHGRKNIRWSWQTLPWWLRQ